MSRKVSAPLDLLFGSGSEAIDSPKATKAVDLGLTLADLFYRSDLPERPSPTSVRLVCIQKASAPADQRLLMACDLASA